MSKPTPSLECQLGECIYCHYKMEHTRHVIRQPKQALWNDFENAVRNTILIQRGNQT